MSKCPKTPRFHVGFEYWRQIESRWRVVEICVKCEKTERREKRVVAAGDDTSKVPIGFTRKEVRGGRWVQKEKK